MADAQIHTAEALVAFVHEALSVRALPELAAEMAAYVKVSPDTFLGVPRPGRVEVEKMMKRAVVIRSPHHYRQLVAALWAQPHREKRHLAINLARMHRKHITPESMPLYERMIREGAWWDLVDPIATWLVGIAWREHRSAVDPVMDRFIADDNFWIRRTALYSQLQHREQTDTDRLFAWCLRCGGEREFFICKAIGTALRQHSRTAPDAIRRFLLTHRARLSPLSVREGARHLDPAIG